MDKTTKIALGLGTASVLLAAAMAISDYHNNYLALGLVTGALASYGFAGWHFLYGDDGASSEAPARDLRTAAPSIQPLKRPGAADPHDISIQDAVAYALYGHWPGEKEIIFGDDGDISRMDNITQRMRALAHVGDLTIWGKATPQSLHRPIDGDFWEHNQIEFMSLWGPPTTPRTESVMSDSAQNYRELRVRKAQVEEHWPSR